jgi:hypothetical protein
MNIITSFRRNWFPVSLALLISTIITSRYLPLTDIPKLSWWNTLWMIPAAMLSIWASSNSWFIFRPIRWFQWPMMKEHLELQLKKMDKNLMAYPALMWLEFNGRDAYIRGGTKAVIYGMTDTGKTIVEGIVKHVTASKRRCDGKGGCGCHGDQAKGV